MLLCTDTAMGSVGWRYICGVRPVLYGIRSHIASFCNLYNKIIITEYSRNCKHGLSARRFSRANSQPLVQAVKFSSAWTAVS